jgi:SAM-dependent methyltransferase
MGVSQVALHEPVLKSFRDHGFKSMLDLGCGIGQYAVAFRTYLPHDIKLYGVDGYFPYLCKDFCRKYDVVIKADVFDFVESKIIVPVDCVLCMDVVEHFERPQALRLLQWLMNQPFAYMSTPLFDFEQGMVDGNVLETHRTWFSREELEAFGWLPLAGVEYDERGWVGAFKNHA